MRRPTAGTRGGAALAVVAWLAIASGCAPITKAPATAVPAPATKAAPPAAATPAPASAATSARSDSLPSPDAERVLASIPEPLSASQQVAPDSTRRRSVVAPEAGYDTLRVSREDGSGTSVPVPSPTPVAAGPVVTYASPESTARAVPQSAPTAAPATAAPPAAAAPAGGAAAAGSAAPTGPAPASGPCWRVQVAAPATREEAESRLEAAESLLMMKMAIVPEKGLFKVRTGDCLTREVADVVKRRALDSGFDGSFLVDTAAAAKPAAPKKKASRGSSR